MKEKSVSVTKERPLSPHLTVYKPQVSSFTSIMHRMTGVFLFCVSLALTWWVVVAIYSSFNPDIVWWPFFSSLTGKIVLAAWTLALMYHFLNGIRHLCWDAGFGFEKKVAFRTGVFVIVLSVVLTVLCWVIALNK